MNAKEGIERSITHNEIVYVEDTQQNHDYLLDACDDCVSTRGITEYWTSDWRVHILLRTEGARS